MDRTFRMLKGAAAMLAVLVFAVPALSSCRRARALGPPKAVVVSEDGRLDLRLMTFNVRYENPSDPGSRAWSQRVIGAVRMIHDEAPDVIGVQEALHGQAADLWVSLPDYEFFGVGRDDGLRAGEYSGIFHRRDRFIVDPSERGTFWLSDTPEIPGSKTWGNDCPRVASWMRLTDRASGRAFYVFNTHWDHRNQRAREKGAALLAKRIAARKHAGEPVVLLGDFNAVEDNPGLALFTQARAGSGVPRFIDTFRALHPDHPARTTLHFWSGSRAGKRKVDHILASEGARVLAAAVRDTDEPMVSDHFPVTARVVFP